MNKPVERPPIDQLLFKEIWTHLDLLSFVLSRMHSVLLLRVPTWIDTVEVVVASHMQRVAASEKQQLEANQST